MLLSPLSLRSIATGLMGSAVLLTCSCSETPAITGTRPVPDGSSRDAIVDRPFGINQDGFTIFPVNPDADEGIDFSATIVPSAPTLIFESGKAPPTITFVVKSGASTRSARWLVDRGEIGVIDENTGVFTASGIQGGTAKVTAAIGSNVLTTTVTVALNLVQNGSSGPSTVDAGSGGWGGVGGEGLGGPVDDLTKQVLVGSATPAATQAMLYPYNNTVWPLGLPPPLLQWNNGATSPTAIAIHLSGPSFEYRGFFSRPSALAAKTPFARHPIPADVWQAATQSAAGKPLTMELTFEMDGKASGPLTQTWKVANGLMRGTVYYQSYGTGLAKNYRGAIGVPGGRFGGATLAIRASSLNPTLVAGGDGDESKCRVCHSVSADGSRMVVQKGDEYLGSVLVSLTGNYKETAFPKSNGILLAFLGLYPDGSIGLTNGGMFPGETSQTYLVDLNTAKELAAPGLATVVTQAMTPAFSPDGKRVAFGLYEGKGVGTSGAGDGTQLVVMDFDRATNTFSNPRLVHKTASDKIPVWVSFTPACDSVIFSVQSRMTPKNEFGMTRNGGRGELWWADLAGHAMPLDQANGRMGKTSYLPVGPNNHDDDTTLHYEPTVNPVPSGGYAWVVFMSRRMYGNVATVDPWWSDPRDHDISVNPTTKKLWVAAVDLDVKPGTDPSHPAFYLPAQELMAGNSRGFWVVDPCKPEGSPCGGGDECCGGYCQPSATTGALVCTNRVPQCSAEHDRCVSTSDCCAQSEGISCLGGRCERLAIP